MSNHGVHLKLICCTSTTIKIKNTHTQYFPHKYVKEDFTLFEAHSTLQLDMGTCEWAFRWSLCQQRLLQMGLCWGLVGAHGGPSWAWHVVGMAGQWLWGGGLAVESKNELPGSNPWSSGGYLASLHPSVPMGDMKDDSTSLPAARGAGTCQV